MHLVVHRQTTKPVEPERCLTMPYPDQAKRSYKNSIIPGTESAGKSFPKACGFSKPPQKGTAFKLQLDEFDFASCDYS